MENEKEVFVKTENISEKLEAEKIKDRLQAHREKRKMLEKLKNVPSLIDSDDEEDAAEWYSRIKSGHGQPDRKKPRLEEAETAELKKLNQKKGKYTSGDLKGLAVGHKLDSFKEGQQIILTLKDKDVLNEDEDILENVNMLDSEKAEKNVENKIKKPDYRPYDDDEFDEFGILKKSTLLSKYDDEIEGPRKEMFRLGESITRSDFSSMQTSEVPGKVTLNLPQLRIASEYYTPEEMVKFKKPSKRKNALRKRTKIEIPEESTGLRAEVNNQNSSTDLDHGSRSKKQKHKTAKESKKQKVELNIDKLDDDDDIIGPDEDLTGIIIDEDEAENELQSALQKARKLKQKETKNLDPASAVSKWIASGQTEVSVKQSESDDEDLEADGYIVLNTTAEFCRNLGDLSKIDTRKPVKVEVEEEEDEEEKVSIKVDSDDDQMFASDSKYRNNWNEVDIKMEEEEETVEVKADSPSTPLVSQPILEEEPDVSVGVAGALKLAMTKGYLDKQSNKPVGTSRVSSDISAQSYLIEEKFYEDDRQGRRDRYSGPLTEFKEKDNYKPDFKLDYVDEKGRMMNQKEAFRFLSHKFHGKGPGKNKIDKRMKKMEQESKLRQMSSVDTPLNTLKLLQDKQKELNAPYIVLSGQRAGTSSSIPGQISKKK